MREARRGAICDPHTRKTRDFFTPPQATPWKAHGRGAPFSSSFADGDGDSETARRLGARQAGVGSGKAGLGSIAAKARHELRQQAKQRAQLSQKARSFAAFGVTKACSRHEDVPGSGRKLPWGQSASAARREAQEAGDTARPPCPPQAAPGRPVR